METTYVPCGGENVIQGESVAGLLKKATVTIRAETMRIVASGSRRTLFRQRQALEPLLSIANLRDCQCAIESDHSGVRKNDGPVARHSSVEDPQRAGCR